MNKIDEKKIKDIIHTVGLNNNLTDNQVKDIIESQFRFIYQEIRKLQLDNLSDEEIDKLKTTFYLKYIGKIYTNSQIVRGHESRINYLKALKESKHGRKEEFESSRSNGDCNDIPRTTNNE